MTGDRHLLVMLPPHDQRTAPWPARLESAVPAIRVVRPETREETIEALGRADAAYGALPAELLPYAGRLRWLQSPQAGPPPGFYYPELVRHPVRVTNMRDTYTDHVAAHTMALVLALARGLPRYTRDQLAPLWAPDWSPDAVIPLPEVRALIVGTGAVGAEVGRLLAAFGTEVEGIDARQTVAPPGFTRLHRPERLEARLPEADLVIVTLPHTPHTEGLINAERLALMKPTACLVNVGRGQTVRLDALTEALDKGRLRAAALDVFETEPLPAQHPLWRRPDVLITPHVAGAGPHADERRLAVLLDNAKRFTEGKPLINEVEKANWY
ncbi:D-3-phosphoglycerate dehydrogenase [Streptomyces sp. L-9-10]|uniref:D-2-hydroxyacid dehydrogenase n=1 Tax=unclassified Streptomyces TaxID=2593676 RepID=UPI00101CAB54|nr:D-2-hydroxyacid dehydrogenase [Streptomyces sp. L-9-10]RYJ29826.1 D-3-phosphoglycerate dehydrogenase [Streptomyces sp. L-9-10]